MGLCETQLEQLEQELVRANAQAHTHNSSLQVNSEP